MTSNLLLNGGFEGNLYQWTGTAGIQRTLGYPRLGCVQLDAGEVIDQLIGVSANVIDASYNALHDSLVYKLFRDGAAAPSPARRA